MAIGDVWLGGSPSGYRSPNAYRDALKAEALKRASYLSSMDQFYAQLEEAQRQYNETLSFKEKVFSEELDYKRWLAEEEIRLREKALGLEEEKLQLYQDQADKSALASNLRSWAGLKAASLEAQTKASALDLEKEKFTWLRDVSQDILSPREEPLMLDGGLPQLTSEEYKDILEKTGPKTEVSLGDLEYDIGTEFSSDEDVPYYTNIPR